MAWIQTSRFTISSLAVVRFELGSSPQVQSAGIVLEGLPPSAYEQFGYLWAFGPAVGSGFSYETQVDVGPIWGPNYRWPLSRDQQLSGFFFKPTPNLPRPITARFIYFIS